MQGFVNEQGKRKDARRLRTRESFVRVAKEIVSNEGHRAVSVRKVAEAAGYSYAALYSYFRDVEDLLNAVRILLIEELAANLDAGSAKEGDPRERFIAAFQDYAHYYLEHPNVFKFFYYRRSEAVSWSSDARFSGFGSVMEQIASFVTVPGMTPDDLLPVAKICMYTVHGALLLFFSGDSPHSEASLKDELGDLLRHLLPE